MINHTNEAINAADLVLVVASDATNESLGDLISTISADFPAPLGVLQYSDERRLRTLADDLAHRTAATIEVVQHQARFVPGTCYLIPAQQVMTLTNGEITLKAESADGAFTTIDEVLSAAAAAYGDTLITVLLSRTAVDGAVGALAASNAGGTIMVQALGNADPIRLNSHIPPHIINFEVAVPQMTTLMCDLVRGIAVPQDGQPNEAVLQELLEHINEQTSLDFRSYKPATLLRRISRRMVVLHQYSMGEYLQYIREYPAEVGELVQAFLINVTQFFRDTEAFAFLRTDVMPTLIEQARHDKTLRFWSAGCASGEEAYSLAMLISMLLGAELPQWSIKIFATDLDAAAISFARAGVYPESLLNTIPPEYRQRFFERVDYGYRIAKPLRQMVIFGHQDLSRNAPFPRMDLVLCRNVLIYFASKLQEYVLDQFAFSLRPRNGYLFLGKAELIRSPHAYFTAVNKQWKIYQSNGDMTPVSRRNALYALPTYPLTSSSRPLQVERTPNENGTTPISDISQLRRFNEGLLRFLPFGVVLIDKNYHLLTANAAARRLLALHESNTEPDFLHAVRGIPYTEVRTAIDTVFRDRNPVTLPEMELETFNGRNGRYLLLTIVPMYAEHGSLEYAAISVTDVTEQVQTRQQLETAQVVQNQMVGELNTANKRLNDLNSELVNANEELQTANEEMMATYEELQASNEEFEATNEELQATNEELETNNEELQATNEELETTNEELRARTGELQDLAMIVESERMRLAEMVELAPFYITVLHGPDLVVEAFNPRYIRVLKGRQVQGRPLAEVFGFFWADRAMLELVRAAYVTDHITTSPRIASFIPNDQKEMLLRTFIYTIVPTHDVTGAVDGVVMYGVDETEHEAAKNKAEREQLQVIFENVGQTALALYDADTTTLLLASPRYLDLTSRLHGFPADQIIGRSWAELSLITPRERAQHQWQAVLDTKQTQQISEVLLSLPDEAPTTWQWSSRPICTREPHEFVRYVLMSAVEITDYVATRQNLEQLDRLRDEFLLLASHELRTPLTPLMGYASAITRLIDKPVPLDDTRRDRLSKLTNSFRGQLERMNRLITDLVDVGRLQTGKMILEKHSLDLRTVVREAAEQTQMGTPNTTIRLQIEPANQPVLVNGDADRLIQIVLNLLQNAIKHANSPTIDLRLQRTNGNHDQPARAVIEVQDYGQGIASQHLDRLWARFYQVEGTSPLTQTGLGLGLFIAKHLAEQHDGTIAVESEVGTGSIFRVTLPLV